MALGRQSIDIACDADLSLRCPGCDETFEMDKIAMLVRRPEAGPFETLCAPCAHEIIRAAMMLLSVEEALVNVIS